MGFDTKKYLLIAFRELMRPIIRLVLRNGLMYKEFMQICKSLYVELASEEYGVRGRQTNISRVALLTGLDRKEVKRVRDSLQESENNSIPSQHNADRISRILSGWHLDPLFVNEFQQPKELSIDGGDSSFTSLVRKYGSDVPITALLKEFLRVGIVTQAGALIRVHKRFYIPDSQNLSAIQRMGNVVGDVTATLHHNFYGNHEVELPRFERCATNLEIDKDHLPKFNQFVSEAGQQFLEEVDTWLSAHEIKDKSSSNKVRLGMGVYWIQGESAIEVAS